MSVSAIKNTRNAKGFTLVELLLAVTLMSILLALTYTGLRAATRSSERGEQILAAGGELRAAHQFMRRQLNQMLPLPFARLRVAGHLLELGAEDLAHDLLAARAGGDRGSRGARPLSGAFVLKSVGEYTRG